MDFTMRSKIFHFNPRSREGSDAITAQELPRLDGISIHAPAKGATSLVLKGTQRKIISIHAPAKGATPESISRPLLSAISIHAPAKGATKCSIILIKHHINFNPRSREGSDRNPRIISTISKDFNPRSREGSDKSPLIRSKYV